MYKLTIDGFSGDVSYQCNCGRVVTVPAADLVEGSADYCGCGREKINFSKKQVNEQRQMATLPELE